MAANSLITHHKIQYHYWFSDRTHTMDALVHNKCERELLETIRAVASLASVSVRLETEPSAKGGLKGWITIQPKNPKKTPLAKVSAINFLVVAAMNTPLHASIATSAASLFELLMKQDLPDELKGAWALEVENLKHEVNEKLSAVEASAAIKKRRSNFFDHLRKYQKVRAVSLSVIDESKKALADEQLITRDSFKNFIVVADQVTPEILDNATIEIISPVLNKGNYKWKGMYKGATISFSMKSNEFMELVQSGKVEFKSGTTIQCTLEIERKINSEGQERITSYNIIQVASYLENGKSIETVEGKQQKQKQHISKRQLDLFG